MPARWRCGVVLAPLAASVIMAAPAKAHDSLVGANPSPAQVVINAPFSIRLAFTGTVTSKPAAPHIQVVGPGGKHYETACAAVDHSSASVSWRPGPRGTYKVTWRVVSDDGHPSSGNYTFSYAGKPGPAPTSTPKCDDASSGSSPHAGVIMLALAICLGSAGGVAALIYRERHPSRPLGYYEDDDEI